jgi:hypothetical protein
MRNTRARRAPSAPARRSFGLWLTSAMMARRQGYNQAYQMAVALGVPRERVSDWVLNIAVPNVAESTALAKHLGIPLSELQAARAP